MEDNTDRERASSTRRLTLTRQDFDDYLVEVTVKLRSNSDVDHVLSEEIQHPLMRFQPTLMLFIYLIYDFCLFFIMSNFN